VTNPRLVGINHVALEVEGIDEAVRPRSLISKT
jgi:hypothetical protein